MTRKLFFTILVAALTVGILSSCSKQVHHETQKERADSLMNAAYQNHDYNVLIAQADELQASGDLSDMKAFYWRGYAYSRQQKIRLAESNWQRAIATEIHTDEDMEYYSKSANRLAGALLLKGEYEQTMKVAVPAMGKMQEAGLDQSADYACLLVSVGCCQLQLGVPNEAARYFDKAYQLYLILITQEPILPHFTSAIVGVITITDNYLLQKRYEEAYRWSEHFSELIAQYQLLPNFDERFLDKQQARLNLYRASALEGLGHHAEAAKAYNDAVMTRYAATNEGMLEATNYLMSAQRWDEAAKNFEVFDEQVSKYGVKFSLDIIQHYLTQKYRANIGAKKTDAALAVGTQICNALDSAILKMQQDEALELATLYSVQQKEREMMLEKNDFARQRYWAIIIALIIVLLFIYHMFIFRHKTAKRLQAANSQLEIANERIKESSRMKTAFISQMSHEIRTPLNVLTGFAQVISTPDITLDEETKQDINRKIMENTTRITELVNKMLELSDVSSKTVIDRNDTVPVVQIAAEAVAAFPMGDRYQIPIELELGKNTTDIQILTNEQSATRILVLLLDNAEKYTKTGTIRLLVETDSKHTVRYIVEDTGIGIPKADAERVFEKFVQLDESKEGTGIGLTVARSMAQRLGGDVVLDTNYTSGARFIMTLPV